MGYKRAYGFTIVELIIVLVVIGILATITAVVYGGITNKASETAAKSGLQSAKEALEAYVVFNKQYPANLATAGLSGTDKVSFQYSYNNSTNPKTWCVTATSNTTSYYQTSSMVVPQSGGCPGHGVGGNDPVTNLFTNPSAELNLTGWAAALAGVTFAADTGEKHSGTRSIKVITPGAAVAEGIIATVNPGDMAGNPYSGGIWVKAPVGATLYATIRTSGSVAQDNPQVSITGNGTWQFYKSENKIAQSDATVLQVHVRTRATVQAITFYVDDAIAIKGPALSAYADGNSPNWVWNGTPNASTSTGPAL